ncbi:MAG: M67 family metallopeptidase [Candidatus Schekmanbacteria bacterium]|nr:M67 family metallopeptidase [Candidatus Schekmanbacteria bacterium]
MLKISRNLLEDIYQHVRRDYPYECCGIITGRNDPIKEVLATHPVANLNKERTHDRYELDPRQFQLIDDQARKQGLSVLGFYHSHPDHPCAPSEFDRDHAWEGYSYMIIAIAAGQRIEVTSWTINDKGRFEEEEIGTE